MANTVVEAARAAGRLMTRKPHSAYPHLVPDEQPSVQVQIGLTDINLRSGWSWPERFAYVLFKLSENRTRPTRIMFSKMAVDGWRLGTCFELWASGHGTLGTYMIVGVLDEQTREDAGQVPDRLIKSCLML